MYNRIKNYIIAYITAAQAGWIAGGCIRHGGACVIDDENEVVIGCIIHEAKIDELARHNTEAWNNYKGGK
jgi:hypothetical protein